MLNVVSTSQCSPVWEAVADLAVLRVVTSRLAVTSRDGLNVLCCCNQGHSRLIAELDSLGLVVFA